MQDFKVGDNAVYPGHGVGRIVSIDSKEIMGSKHTFYTLEIIESGIKVMVPKKKAEIAGLRPIICEDQMEDFIRILKKKDVKLDRQTWNRRYREYMEKIKTGSIFEIAEVLRDLYFVKVGKELSFGEKKMLDKAKGLLLKELRLANLYDQISSEKELKQFFEM